VYNAWGDTIGIKIGYGAVLMTSVAGNYIQKYWGSWIWMSNAYGGTNIMMLDSLGDLWCLGNLSTSGKLSMAVPAEYADDAAAATGGIAVGQTYRTGSVLKIRVS
jgi:hypothetical protein